MIVASFDHIVVMIMCTIIEIKYFYFKYFYESTMWMIKPLGGLVTIVSIILVSSTLFIGLLVFHLSKLVNL